MATNKIPKSFSLTSEVIGAVDSWVKEHPWQNRSDLVEVLLRKFFHLGETDITADFAGIHQRAEAEHVEQEQKVLTKREKWLGNFVEQLKRKQGYEQDEFIQLQSGLTGERLGEELTVEFLIDYAKSKGVRL